MTSTAQGAFSANVSEKHNTSESPAEWIALATLLRPQGRRGELLSDLGTDLRELFQPGLQVSLSKTDKPILGSSLVTLQSHWFPTGKNAGRIVLKLSGTDSIDDAEKLQGLKVLVPVASLPKLEADTYFVKDLLGCLLLDEEEPVGEVVDVEFATGPDGRTRLADAAPLLVVELPEGEDETEEATQVLIPLIRAWIKNADIANKRLHMTLPKGLLEEAAEETDTPQQPE